MERAASCTLDIRYIARFRVWGRAVILTALLFSAPSPVPTRASGLGGERGVRVADTEKSAKCGSRGHFDRCWSPPGSHFNLQPLLTATMNG
jgi:hypothetical protein